MFLRQSTLAVAVVIALSAAAATTQVFAADEFGSASTACSGALVQAVQGNGSAFGAAPADTWVETRR